MKINTREDVYINSNVDAGRGNRDSRKCTIVRECRRNNSRTMESSVNDGTAQNKKFSSSILKFDPNHSYALVVNNVFNRPEIKRTKIVKEGVHDTRGGVRWIVSYMFEWTSGAGPMKVSARESGKSIHEATNLACFTLLNILRTCHPSEYLQGGVCAEFQMEKSGVQGLEVQDSDRSQNTIITRDQGATESVVKPVLRSTFNSSEKTHAYPDLMERWYPLPSLKVGASQPYGSLLETYRFPRDLYKLGVEFPNITPLKIFVLGRYNIRMKFVVNGHKMMTGKLLVAAKPADYQGSTLASSIQAMLCRPHVMLDLSTNCEGEIVLPYKYYRPMISNLSNRKTPVRNEAYMGSVQVGVLSPLKVADGEAVDMELRAFAKFEEVELAAMSYRAEYQMDDVIGSVVGPKTSRALRELIGGAERALDQFGGSPNRDKPTSNEVMMVVPRPRMFFPNAKGLSDCTVMRMNPVSLTSFHKTPEYKDEPKTMLDVARIWGIYQGFPWKASAGEGSTLMDIVIDPSVRTYNADFKGSMTPLEYATSMYKMWGGTIETRFDFITNGFHTGALMISAEYERAKLVATPLESFCTYTKTFHLGEQKSVDFTIPYIYDSPVRLTATAPYMPFSEGVSTFAAKTAAANLVVPILTRLKLTVINSLHTPSTSPPDVNVIMYVRAGEDYMLSGLIPPPGVFYDGRMSMQSWPASLVLPTTKTSSYASSDSFGNIDKGKLTLITAENQMDAYGDAKDPTRNFEAGKSNWDYMTNDAHVDLVDIMRRPCMYIDHGLTSTDTDGFFVPVMIPSRNWPNFAPYNPQVLETPQVAVSNLFRGWRGSVRYNLVIKTDTINPVYVTYLPYSGVRIMGNTLVSRAGKGTRVHQAGLMTEIIIPRINSTANIEIPFEFPYDWCVLGKDNPSLSLPWEEMVVDNIGHIVITCRDPIRFDLWVSVGDDFTFGNFWGVSSGKVNQWAYELITTDKPIQVTGALNLKSTVVGAKSGYLDEKKFKNLNEVNQEVEVMNMGFQAEKFGVKIEDALETTSSLEKYNWFVSNVPLNIQVEYSPQKIVSGLLPKIVESKQSLAEWQTRQKITFQMEDFRTEDRTAQAPSIYERIRQQIPFTKNALMTGALASVPVVGPGLVIGKVATDVSQMCSTVQNTVTTTENDVRVLLTNLGSSVSLITDKFGVSLDKMSALLTSFVGTTQTVMNWGGLMCELLIDILVAWATESWAHVGISIVKVLCKGFDVSISKILEWGTNIGSYVSSFFVPGTQAEDTTLLAVLLGIVGTVVGCSLNADQFRSFGSNLGLRLTSASGIQYFLVVLRFIKETFESFKGMLFKAMGYVDPEIYAIQMLSNKSDAVKKFASEASIILNEANSRVIIQPRYRIRFWQTVMQAYQLRALMLAAPMNAASPHLARLCGEVIKVGNEKFVDISSSPVRYEPFVICITGAPGIGKSFLTEKLVRALLESVGITKLAGEACFYRTPGSKFWSGYRDQPAIVYDDWLNLRSPDKVEMELSELYQLKSTSAFIPDMAHLEEKKMRGNPLIVILNCNEAYPHLTLSLAANYAKAILRRRDVVVSAQLKETCLTGPRDLPTSVTDEMGHLQFQYYNDVADSRSMGDEVEVWDDFLNTMKEKFNKWHTTEIRNVSKRVERVQQDLSGVEVANIRIHDPFSLFYGYHTTAVEEINQNAWIPSEMLESAITDLLPMIEQNQDAMFQVDGWSFPTVGEMLWEFANSKVGFSTILHKVDSVFSSINHSLLERAACGLTVECVVCAEQRIPFARCAATQGDLPHYVCMGCYEGIEATPQHGKCPLCRLPSRLVTETELGVTTVWWLKIATKLGLSVKSIVQRMMRLMQTTSSLWLVTTVISFVTRMTAACILGTDRFKTFMSTAPFVTFDVVSVLYPTAFYQVDGVEEELYLPHIVGERWAYVTDHVDTDQCLHHYVNEQVNSVRYVKGKWIVRVANQNMEVNDCLCSVNCSWESRSLQNEFYTQYLGREFARLKTNINLVRSNILETERIKETIPIIFQPGWMEESVMLDELRVLERPWWDNVVEWIQRWKDVILWAIGLAAAAASAWASLRWLYPTEVRAMPEFGNQGYDPSYDRARTRAYRHPRTPDRIVRFPRHQVEGQSVTNDAKIMVLRNYVTIIMKNGGDELKMHGVGLYGSYCLIPNHYVSVLKEGEVAGKSITVEMSNCEGRGAEVFSLKHVDLQASGGVDLALITMPKSFPLFKDIRKFMATLEDFTKPMSREASILLPPRAPTYFVRDVAIELSELTAGALKVDTMQYDSRDVLQYNFSKKGACGSLVFIERSTRPIVGMHFAGIGEERGTGYAIILTQDHFKNFDDMNVVVEHQDGDWEDLEGAKVIPDGAIILEGTTTLVPFLPSKSKIRKSLLYGMVEGPYTEPVILARTDPRYIHSHSPLHHGASKHGQLTVNFPIQDLREVGKALYSMLYSGMTPVILNPKKLTVEESVRGFDGVEYYDRMALATSAGWPYNTTGKKLKKDYISCSEQGVVEVEEDLLNLLRTQEEIRKTGRTIPTLFVDTLKDERKLMEKIAKIGSTRVFCNPPLEYVIAIRQNFLPFSAAFYKHRHSLKHAVGINPLGNEWSLIANKLFAHNPRKILSLDYSNFGPGFNAGVGHQAAEILIAWTLEYVKGVEERELRCLLMEATQSLHLVTNTVYRQTSGSPSGSPLTVIINSLVNQLYIMLAWQAVCPEGFIWDKFDKHVVMFVYGDDTIMSVSEEAAPWFNGDSIGKFFAKHGVVATDAGKSSKMEFVSLQDATFLKRGFTHHPFREMQWLGPLDWRSVVDIINFVWESADRRLSTEENIVMAYIQAFAHGPQRWEQFQLSVSKAAAKQRLKVPFITWKQLDHALYGGGKLEWLDSLVSSMREVNVAG